MDYLLELIVLGLFGTGGFLLMGSIIEKEKESWPYGIAIALLALGFFIGSLAN